MVNQASLRLVWCIWPAVVGVMNLAYYSWCGECGLTSWPGESGLTVEGVVNLALPAGLVNLA